MVVGLLLATGASLTASVLVLQMAVLPLLFRYSRTVQRKIVFSNCFNYPRNLDYENPSCVDVVGGRQVNIEFKSQADKQPIKIGAWHMIPCSLFRQVFIIRDYHTVDQRLHRDLQNTTKPIVLYCHGNSNHRASPQRLQLYKVFQELNFHVIAFDYRGYGDSTMIRPTERGVVEDAFAVYSWLHETISQRGGEPSGSQDGVGNRNSDEMTRPLILLWGHSLGSAVAANLAAHLDSLCEENGKPHLPKPDALVLEAPFNNLMDEIESHPCSKIVAWLPYYKEYFVKPFSCCSEYTFATDQYLTKIPDMPILMLHSKNDKIVPYNLAVKLYKEVEASRGNGGAPVVFHTFDKCPRLGHNNICDAKNLKDIITNFLDVLKENVSTEKS